MDICPYNIYIYMHIYMIIYIYDYICDIYISTAGPLALVEQWTCHS